MGKQYNRVQNFGRPSPWTEEITKFVLEGWNNHSATELLSIVNRKFGIVTTRNAIIGLVHRNGLMNTKPRRPVVLKTDEELQAEAQARAAKKKAKAAARDMREKAKRDAKAINDQKDAASRHAAAEVIASHTRAGFAQADHEATLVPGDDVHGIMFADRRMDQCAYPVWGSRANMIVCGDNCFATSSYCRKHLFICTGA